VGAEVTVGTFDQLDDGYRAPSCALDGSARSRLFHPAGYSLWQLRGDLTAGSELSWTTRHGDEALYVLAGCLEVDGQRCAAGGGVVLEATTPAVVRVVTDTSVLHSGTTADVPPRDGPLGPPATDGRSVHVFPSADSSHRLKAVGRPLFTEFFTDGTCRTCRIAHFVIDGRQATDGYTGKSHLHSEDEIIFMIEGSIRLGTTVVAEGQSVAVPANRRYGFRTTGPFRFLNYRGDVASATFQPGSHPVFETVAALAAAGVVEDG
jgi:hypothetical protein